MTAPRPAAPQNRAGPSRSAFFIPDLCAAQAVLSAVLVTLLHVLALGPIREFDWQALANASVFVQWNTLLCLGLPPADFSAAAAMMGALDVAAG